ncbi:MAG: alpha/beta hydrolase [Bacillota bacterium]|nr:alpha/beta hydrolase [Bacillota bacterium]
MLVSILRAICNVNGTHTKSPIRKLRKLDKIFKIKESPKGFVQTWNRTSKGVRFLSIENEEKKADQILLYLHGGGYISGLISTYPLFLTKLASNHKIICLDYKCAPEAIFPSQLLEALELWRYLTEEENIDPSDIIIGGDSAGANLMFALLLTLRDCGQPLPKCGFSISAWADMTGCSNSFSQNYNKDPLFGELKNPLTEEKRKRMMHSELYSFIGKKKRDNPLISPIFGKYHNFIPICFIVGENEMLLDDTLTIVEKLKQEEIPCPCFIAPKMYHIFPILTPFVKEAKLAIHFIQEFLNEQT